MGARGLVLKLPTVQLTMQLVVRHDRFSDAFMQKSRRFFADQYDRAMRSVRAAEDDILFLYPPPDKDRQRYVEMMNESRLFLIEAGVYDKDMMRWMKKARCKVSPERGECSSEVPW